MEFSSINEGRLVTDEHGVTYSSDGGILLHINRDVFRCRDYVIPQSTRIIWEGAFRGIGSLERITFPAGLEYIGEYAFSGCGSLREAILPYSVCFMGQNAFSFCSSLKKAVLPSGLRSIPCECFLRCESLEDVTLPEGIECIGICGFTGCGSLRHISLPESTRWLEDTAFTDCALELVELPDGLESIGEDCFRGCPLDRLVIPENVERILPWIVEWHPGFMGITCRSPRFRIERDALIRNSDGSMLCCWSCDEEYVIPESVRHIEGFANPHCRKVTARHHLESVCFDCFLGCSSLKEIELAQVDYIADTAFPDGVMVSVDGKSR